METTAHGNSGGRPAPSIRGEQREVAARHVDHTRGIFNLRQWRMIVRLRMVARRERNTGCAARSVSEHPIAAAAAKAP